MNDETPRLMVVRSGECLYWPPALGGGIRGGAGYATYEDDPLINGGGLGQSHKLSPAPPGTSPSPVRSRIALRAYAAAGYTRLSSPVDPPRAARPARVAPEPATERPSKKKGDDD